MQQPAECIFAISLADRAEVAGFQLAIAFQLAIVRVGPVTAPQLTGKRVGILQRHFTAISLADMRNHRTGLNRIFLHQTGDRRVETRLGIFKRAATVPFIEGNAPTIFMWPGTATALNQPGKAKANIGRYVCAHPEQFTHRLPLLTTLTPSIGAQHANPNTILAGAVRPLKPLSLNHLFFDQLNQDVDRFDMNFLDAIGVTEVRYADFHVCGTGHFAAVFAG